MCLQGSSLLDISAYPATYGTCGLTWGISDSTTTYEDNGLA